MWLRGPNIAQGYWADAEQTARTFRAQIVGEAGEWLRTGDLGRVRAGAIYITGRMKDLIIVNGRNIYPQDIERVIDECHADVRPGCAAAFAVTGVATEEIGVAFEVRDPEAADQTIVESACAAVARALDVQLSMVALLLPRTLLKTTSGKPQRQAIRAALEDGSLATLLLWRAPRTTPAHAESTDVIAALAGWISAYTGRPLSHDVDSVGLDDLGVDSLGKAELLDWIHGNFGRALTMDQLLDQSSVAKLAACILADAGPIVVATPPTLASTVVLPSLSWLGAK